MTQMSKFARTIFKRTYAQAPEESWEGCASRVAKMVAGDNKQLEKKFFEAIASRKFIPGGRYLYSAGREINQTSNCFLNKAEDSREGWADLLNKHVVGLSTGGGAGTYYGDVRPKGAPIQRFGGQASGPVPLMQMVNEVARHVIAGGTRRSALWAGLPWWHDDIEEFIGIKDWKTSIRAMKEQDFNNPAPLDMTNISVCLDDRFFEEIETYDSVKALYYKICKSMCKSGEPGFSIDVGKNKDQVLRNACTEIVSSDDGDSCNLGSINLSRVGSLEELAELTALGTEFLYRGTALGWLPHQAYYTIRDQNHRIGLGLMGIHEWCLTHDQGYEPSALLGEWLQTWKAVSEETATCLSVQLNSPYPAGLRAIAPTGTISIIGETTSGIEPIFCVAYKRRFLGSDHKWKFMYVVDPTAQRLIQEKGIRADAIEDAYTLAQNVEQRLKMQAFIQEYVDQGISSTINIPEWGEPGNNNSRKFADILLQYLPKLRGITVYPDGSRAGQPLTPLAYNIAIKHAGVVFEESEERCKGGVCGI